jgi:methylated-DNA-[protein]-cysteine S-methyltransferase
MNVSLLCSTPIGNLEIMATENFITKVTFIDSPLLPTSFSTPILEECQAEIKAYFAGKLQRFSVPLQAEGTIFQQQVWQELQNIPFGKTISYLELARRLGNEKVIRAAGTANGKNPIAILIPCHRVIGSNGTLVGYAGKLWRKKYLLDLENALPKTLF